MTLLSGGTVTDVTEGSITYRYHHFYASDIVTVISPGFVDYLVLAGGGPGGGHSGGGAGGGGAGGYQTSEDDGQVELTVNETITVGAGGVANNRFVAQTNNGGDSSIGALVVATGGGWGAHGYNGNPGNAGGSGGGGGVATTAGGGGGAGTAGQGFAGGSAQGASSSSGRRGGMGGGAANAGSGSTLGDGRTWYDGVKRGHGGAGTNRGFTPAVGGANTGDGGGGASGTGFNGGSGIVILRYPLIVAQADLGALTATAQDARSYAPRLTLPRHLVWVHDHVGERVMVVD